MRTSHEPASPRGQAQEEKTTNLHVHIIAALDLRGLLDAVQLFFGEIVAIIDVLEVRLLLDDEGVEAKAVLRAPLVAFLERPGGTDVPDQAQEALFLVLCLLVALLLSSTIMCQWSTDGDGHGCGDHELNEHTWHQHGHRASGAGRQTPRRGRGGGLGGAGEG